MFIPKTITFIAAMAFAKALTAINYYVSNAGSDDNTGLSLQSAFLTLQHAANHVIAGDTVFVSEGGYAGFDLREAYGAEGHPIVFKALGNAVEINQSGPIRNDGINVENCSHIVIDGFRANNMPGNGNGIRVVLSDFCVVRNCSCDNNAERGIFTAFTDDIIIEYNTCSNSVDEHGIYVSNSSDRPIVRYNECYGNNNIGIHFNGDLSAGGDGIISDAQVYGNIIYENNLAAGINMDGVENPVIYNNLIFDNHFAQGIALFQQDGAISSRGAKIFNNTIIVPPDGRWGILAGEGSNVGTKIYNNIIINHHQWRGCIALENTAGFQSNYNILNDKMSADGDGASISLANWQFLGFDVNSLLAEDPENIFANPGGADFHLKPGSQAIDAGTGMVDNIVAADIEGHPRPMGAAFDIGAYEYAMPNGADNVFGRVPALYPNPATDFIFLYPELGRNVAEVIRLLDSNGRLVRRFAPESHRLDVRGISRGAFFLEVHLKNGRKILSKVAIH